MVLTVCSVPGAAQDDVRMETRSVPQLTTIIPIQVRIRQKSGITASGTLISITEEYVKFRTPRGKEVEVSLDKISNIRTTDGDLDYSPAREDFADLVARANSIPGLSRGTTTIEVPVDPAAKPVVPPADPAMPPGGRPSVPLAADPAVPDDPAMVDPATPGAKPGSVIYTCGSCGKVLPGALKNGERCPHCGILIFNSSGPAGAPPAARPGGNTAPPAAAANPGGAPAAQPGATPTSNTVVTQSPGAGFEDAPMWMKVGLFVGMIAVAWVIFQRR
ncbi:MAG: hypothetical protein DWQ45_19625 [Planctomycetota bacterium]|nr:MAG: hypothetical protein DWQ29_08340 [Planctomycetota bacterium]REK31536.1 MAG: hypothetical protein DWQ45_19625 [Planctomycetota bacterium]